MYEGNGQFVSPETRTVAQGRPNYTFDNYFITPIEMVIFKVIALISTLLVSVLR